MKKFEQHVHDRFDGREVQVDKNELWANIAPQLEYKKKNRKGAWLFLFGLLTGSGLLGAYFMSFENNDINTAHTINTTITTEQVAESTASGKNQTIDLNTTKEETNQATTSKRISPKPTETRIVTNNTVIANKTTTKKVALHRSATKPSTTEPNTDLLTTNKNNTVVENKVTTLQSDQNAFEADKGNTTLEQSILGLNTLPLLPFEKSIFATKETATDNNLIKPKKSKSRLGVGFYGGISKTQSALKERSESDYNYAQLRGSTEDQLQTLHLGVNTVVELKRNFYFQTGLEYSRITSRLNLNDEGILIDTVLNTLVRNIDLTDTAVVIPDNHIAREVETNKTKTHFHLFDIPVLAGYQFGNARWRMGVEAGAFLNISLQKEGEILQEELEIYNLDEDNREWYKTNVGIRPYLGLTSTYDLTRHYQLYFSTGITFNKVFSTDANPIKEEKSMFGMRLGGRYFF